MHMNINTPDLKPKQDYYLTYDFWPNGGKRVRLVGTKPAKDFGSRARGECAIVRDDEGQEYAVGPHAYLFSTPPTSSQDTP